MLCIAGEPIDVAMYVKIHNLIQSRKGTRNGQIALNVLDRSNLAEMIPGEKLHVIGHGDGTTFGVGDYHYTAVDLAKTLVAKGLRGDIDSIKLSGCRTGEDVSTGVLLAPRYCQEVTDTIYELTKSKVPIRLMVTGFTSIAVTDQTGTVRAKDPALKSKYGHEYTEIISRYTKDLENWKSEAAKMDTSTPGNIIANANIMATKSSKMFDELYKHNPKVIKGKEDSKYRGLPLNDL